MATSVLAYSDSKVFSGAEAVFCDVVAGLRRQPGLEVVTAAPSGNVELVQGLTAGGGVAPADVPAQALTLAGLDLMNPLRLRAVSQIVEAQAPEVLLVNLPSAEYGALPLRIRSPGMRRVGLLHIARSPQELAFRLGRVRASAARAALRSLDAVCVLSANAAADFQRWNREGTTVGRLVYPRPQVSSMPAEEARAVLGLDQGMRWIGIAGRISIRQKGHDTFVRAAAALRRSEGARLGFAVAGAGRDRDRLEQLVREAGLLADFRFLGEVRPIDPFLSAIDALAIPSRFEGLPLIALEALAVGLPGVAAAVDGLQDLWPVEWLVPPDDSEALAEALASVLGAEPITRESILGDAWRRMQEMTADDPAAAVAEVLAP